MTNGDREGLIFLSHPHTNNGFFNLLTTILEKHEKGFQKILHSLRCDMMTSFYHYNVVTELRVAYVWLFVVCLSHWLVRVCGKNRIHRWCSAGTGKSQPESPRFQWETKLAKFPHVTKDPRVGIFFWNN